MTIQTFVGNWNFFSLGEKMLFLPLVLIIVIVFLGLVLFLVTNLICGLARIPRDLLSQTVDKNKDEEAVFKHHIHTDTTLKAEDLIVGLKSGSWLIWVAVLPIILFILMGIIYLVSITPLPD